MSTSKLEGVEHTCEGEKMGKREPLKVGDRVRVYAMAPGTLQGTSSIVDAGTITGLAPGGGVLIQFKRTKQWWHEKQCRRLIPRKRAAPSVKGERMQRWADRAGVMQDFARLWTSEKDAITAGLQYGRKVELVHLLEIRPGEVLLDRERLAAAWSACLGHAQERDEKLAMIISSHRSRVELGDLCKALGLPEGGAR